MNDIRTRIKLEEEIKKVFYKNNQEFFSYAWRENIKEFLTTENRYTQLLQWINERLEIEFGIMNVFNPADKDETFTNTVMKDYLDACQKVSILLNAKIIIMDEKCTTKMRENWEYTLCKLFNLKYDNNLGFINKRK